MAKVTMPLASFIATGKFGPLVYDKRGIVRRFVFPRQPNTDAQIKRRLIFKAATAIAALAGEQRKSEFMAQYQTAWYSQMIKKYCDAKPQEYEELSTAQQEEYDSVAVAGGITPLTTNVEEQMTAGEILYRAITAFGRPETEIEEFLNWWKS
jgi:hypothetical protein